MKQESAAKSSTFTKERKRAARVAKAERARQPDEGLESIGPTEIVAVGGKGKARQPGRRGPQKLPTKVAVTVRYSQEVLEYFKATGEGWQTRMNDVLRLYVQAQRQDEQRQQERAA